MTIRTPEEAVAASLAQETNVPDTCQYTVRGWLNAPSAGDRDGDGDADAVDGWLSEPLSARHPGDRHPPEGHPVAWSGGSHGNGHRALSLGGGRVKIRSTDAGGRGITATVPLAWVEQTWGLKYLGWSDTIDGYPIPKSADDKPAVPKPIPLEQRAKVIRRLVRRARKNGHKKWAERLLLWSDRLATRATK